MKEKILNILILEDSLHDKILITEQLAEAGFQFTVTHVENSHSFTDALNNSTFDLIISDFNLPEYDAFAALELCKKKCPDVPFICVSGSIGEETAVELLKKGAVDYVLKDRPDRLPYAINRALEEVEIKLIKQKAEQELKESETRFRQVAEAANEWIWEVDTEGLYTYSSPMLEKLLGYTPEEVVGKKHFYDFYFPDDREIQKKAAFQVFSQRGVFSNYENENQKKDGSLVILSTSGSPVFDDHGNFIGYRGVDADITGIKSFEAEQKRLLRQVERDRLALLSILEDYKKAEKQLRKLSQAVEQSPASTIITNTDGIIEYVNPKFLEVTGYELGEVIGKKPNILKSGLQTNEFYKEIWDTIISGKDWSGEIQNQKKDGTPYWESARISPIKNEKGETLNYVAVKEDITEIKQAENNFRQSLDQSPIGIRIESQTGETVYANNAFLKIYEMTSLSEFTHTPTEIRYDAVSYLEHLERKRVRQAGGEIAEYEISIQRKSGEIRHVKVWRKEVIWNRQKHFQIINLDITRQKLAEQALQKSEERFRIVQELSPDGFTIFHPVKNKKGQVIDFEWVFENQAIAKINGTDPEEVKGKRLLEIFPAHKNTTLFEKYIHVACTGEHEIIHELNIGDIVSVPTWLRLVIVPLGDDIAILSQDISERIKTELKIKESEKQFRALFTDSATVMLLIDPETGRIIDANNAALKFYGYDRKTITNMKMSSINTLTEKGIKARMDKAMKAKTTYFQFTHRIADGTVKPVEVYSGSIMYSGKDLLYSIVHDITDRKRIELELKNTLTTLQKFGSHLQKAREEEKILLAREIHDDLGQLLVAMKIDTGITKNILNHELTEKLKNEISLKLSNHTEMITKAITSARRIMNGLRPVKLEMLGFAGAAVEYINEFSSRYNIKFVTKIDMNIQKLDEEHSLALYRILQESLNNVVKHANATKVEVIYQEIDNDILLEITDNGVGFNIEKEGRVDSYGLLGIRERVLILNGQYPIKCVNGILLI
jgi:PAS domain S-box-containing protein